MNEQKNDDYYGTVRGGNEIWHSKHGSSNTSSSSRESLERLRRTREVKQKDGEKK